MKVYIVFIGGFPKRRRGLKEWVQPQIRILQEEKILTVGMDYDKGLAMACFAEINQAKRARNRLMTEGYSCADFLCEGELSGDRKRLEVTAEADDSL